ncbi:MAG: hypothetical protein KKA54_05750 [Proteobacteria bacterium]|nr:hypothetical protein [Pseudomonadota bacterium]
MGKKIIRRAAFIIFFATIFFYPVKQFSPAFAYAQLAEAEQEPDVLSSVQEEQLREEAEAPQGQEEQYIPDTGYDETQPQGPDEQYEPDPGYDESQPQNPSEEYVPDPGYDENQPQEPYEEYAPEPGYDENQPQEPYKEYAPEEPGYEENLPQGPEEEYIPEQEDDAQPVQINEEQPAEPVEGGN